MTVARNLLEDLAAIGATIKPAGDRLILRAGRTAIPGEHVSRIRAAKTDLLKTLSMGTPAQAAKKPESKMGEAQHTGQSSLKSVSG